MSKPLNLPKEVKQELLRKELAGGKKASQSRFIPLKDRMRLIRLEKVHPHVVVNFR
jgi:hypothetical protein